MQGNCASKCIPTSRGNVDEPTTKDDCTGQVGAGGSGLGGRAHPTVREQQ